VTTEATKRKEDAKREEERSRKGEFDRADALMRDYFILKREEDSMPPPPDVSYSDDIGECAPLEDLLDMITVGKPASEMELASEVRFPFDRYTKFNSQKLVHDFHMTTLHRDMELLTEGMRKHAVLLDELGVLTNVRETVIRYGEKTAKDAFKRVKSRLDILQKNHEEVFTTDDLIFLKKGIDKLLRSTLIMEMQSASQICGDECYIPQKYSNSCVPTAAATALRACEWKPKPGDVDRWIDREGKHAKWDRKVRRKDSEGKLDSTFMVNLTSQRGVKRGEGNPWEVGMEYIGWMCSTKYGEEVTGRKGARLPKDKAAWKNSTYDVSDDMPFYKRVEAISGSILTFNEMAERVTAGFPCITLINRYHNKDISRGEGWATGQHVVAVIGVTSCNTGVIIHDSSTATSGLDDGSGSLSHAMRYYTKVGSRGLSIRKGDALSSMIVEGDALSSKDRGGLAPWRMWEQGPGDKDGLLVVTFIPKGRKAEFLERFMPNGKPARERGTKERQNQGEVIDRAQKLYSDAGVGDRAHDIVSKMLGNLSTGAYRQLSNNITGKVESLSIDFTPGTCKYIPIEGEEAPVVQSTGGRTVQVTLRLTEVDDLDLSKFAIMFKVTNKEDTLLSMLMLSRSLFKGASRKHRIKYIADYMFRQNLYKNMKRMAGIKAPPRFDEPVRIRNEVLNSLGLNTFVPYSLEVQSDPNKAMAFNVMLTLNYVNLGNRSLETLKLSKSGTDAPILPIACKMAHATVDRKNTEQELPGQPFPGIDSYIQLSGAIAKLSVRFALSEFVPLYVMYRVSGLIKSLISMAEEGRIIDTADPLHVLYANLDPSVRKSMEKLVTSEADEFDTFWARMSETLLHWSPWAILAGGGAIHNLRKVKGAPKMGKGGKISTSIQGGLSIVLGLGGTVLAGMFNHITRKEWVKSKGKPLKTLTINIPTLVPYMIYQMIRDFLNAHRRNKMDEFVEAVAAEAGDLLDMGTMSEGKAGSYRRTIALKPSIKIRGDVVDPAPGSTPETRIKVHKDGKGVLIYDIEKIDLICFVFGLHTKEDVKFELGAWELGKSAEVAGLVKLETELIRNINERILSKEVLDIVPTKEDVRLHYLAAASINLMAVNVINDIHKMTRPFGEEGSLGNLELASIRLLESSSTRKHLVEVLKSVVTISGLDTLAGHSLMYLSKKNGLDYIHSTVFGKRSEWDEETREFLKDGLRMTEEAGKALVNSIVSAGEAASDRHMCSLPLLSGAFVDDSYPTAGVRHGLVDAAALHLGVAEKLALGIGAGHEVNIPPTLKSFLYLTTGTDVSPSLKIVTIGQIVAEVEPHPMKTMIDSLIIVRAKITSFFTEMIGTIALSIAALALAAPSGGTSLIALLVVWLRRLVLAYQIFGVGLNWFANDVLQYAIYRQSLTILSEWLGARLRDGADAVLLLQLCYHAHIWSKSILECGRDAHDPRDTTFVDYPVVRANGIPLSPDFFVHKVGMVGGIYEHMRRSIDDLMDIVDERYAGVNPEDYGDMLKKMAEYHRGSISQELDAKASMISGIIRKLTSDIPKVIGAIGKATVRRGNLSRNEEFAKIVKDIEVVAKFVSFAIFGDEKRGFVNIKVRFTGDKDRQTITTEGVFPSDGNICYILTLDLNAERAELTFGDAGKQALLTAEREWKDAGSDSNSRITTLTVDYNPTDVNIGADSRYAIGILANELVMLSEELIQVESTSWARFEKGQWGTLAAASLLRSLIGHNMKAVGEAGRAVIKTQMGEIGSKALMKSVRFRAGYMFPSIKLFFIEEDMESFYLFDDLYSYASIISVSVHMDRTSPMQTAIIKVTNIHGYLNDIVADEINMETNFTSAPSENSPINALMLRPGCKIKIQAGNTPLLGEENTVFTGRITAVNFSEITVIEAQSHGDVLMEEMATEHVKVYGMSTSSSRNLFARLWEKGWSWVVSKLTSVDHYLRPISRIKDIISYVLTDIVTTSTHLDDFALGSSLEGEIEEGYKPTTNNLRRAIYLKYVPEKASEVMTELGVDVSITANRQLFENIHITGDKAESRWGVSLVGRDDGNWIVSNETAWDVLNDINLLLPNNILTVRPFDTRGTLVWGDHDGYYRYQRKVEMESIGAVLAIQKLIQMSDSTKSKFSVLLKHLNDAVKKNGTKGPHYKALLSLVSLVTYYARGMYNTLAGRDPAGKGAVPDLDTNWNEGAGDNGYSKKAVAWFYSAGVSSIAIDTALNRYTGKEITKQFIKNVENTTRLTTAVDQVIKKIDILNNTIVKMASKEAKFRKAPGTIEIEEISSRMGGTSRAGLRTVRMLISIDAASHELISFMKSASFPNSTSHKKISEYHIKMSGRDIVKNDIELLSPFNTVRLSHPAEGWNLDDFENNAGQTSLEPVATSSPGPIPLHRTLKAWAWKVYSTFFRNIHVFPSAVTSTKSMVISSIQANLMKETYGGTITLLGDATIREGDRIMLWDENRDLSGIIGVRTHTFIMSQEEGCLSIIEPDMVTRTEYRLYESSLDSTLWWMSAISSTVMFGLMALSLGKVGYQALKRMKIMNAQTRSMSKDMNSMTGGKQKGLSDRLAEKAGRYGREFGRRFRNLSLPSLRRFREKSWLWSTNPTVRNGLNSTTKTAGSMTEKLEKRLRNNENINKACVHTINDRIGNGVKMTPEEFTKKQQDAWAASLKEMTTELNAFSRGTGKPDTHLREKFVKHLLTAISEEVGIRKGTGAKGTTLDELTNKLSKSFLGDSVKGGGIVPLRMNPGGTKNNPLINNAHTSYLKGRVDAIVSSSVKGSSVDRTKALADAYDAAKYITLNNWGIAEMIKRQSKLLMGMGGLNWAIHQGKDLIEMCCVQKETQDNIVLGPLTFRGEPFLAGVEGMNKDDGRRMGIMGILHARFSDIITMGYDSAMSPLAESWNLYIQERARSLRRLGPENPFTFISRPKTFTEE
jgi:hypothetical protein